MKKNKIKDQNKYTCFLCQQPLSLDYDSNKYYCGSIDSSVEINNMSYSHEFWQTNSEKQFHIWSDINDDYYYFHFLENKWIYHNSQNQFTIGDDKLSLSDLVDKADNIILHNL